MRASRGGTSPHSLAEIAGHLGGRIAGDGKKVVAQVGSLENAGPSEIAFFASSRFKSQLSQTKAGAIVLAPSAEGMTALPRIVTDDPYAYFARLSQFFNPVPKISPARQAQAVIAGSATVAASARIEAGAVIEEGAVIGERTSIGAGCYVGESVTIGDDCSLYPNVVIYADCRLGSRVVLHSGVVIGADGFGLAREGGRWLKIPQIGRVILGDDVEIGANTTVDRGAIDDTILEEGVKLDNQIQIGHNCRIGAHTAMAGCVGVAGSAKIGRNCTIGAGSIILGHLAIADDVSVSAATVISRSIRHAGTYTGMYPFDDHESWKKNTALIRHISELADRVKALEKRLSDKEKNDG